jgi:BirA family biotin operon repressor/biotin-[acetyl-CoA-carboxylase] ligase
MIELHESTDSTNDLALEAAKEGAGHGACWVADRQTSGRGRREIGGDRREWFSPAGANIYMSVLLRPQVDPDRATALTLASAVGIADALVETTGADIWLKWPNDLYIGDRKIGGILTEANTEQGRLAGVVVGFGINVNLAADQVPEELEETMTSLRIATGERWDRMELTFAVRRQLLERADAYAESGMPTFLEDLRAYDQTDGRAVEIQRGDQWVEGVSQGVGGEGQLVVEVDGKTVDVQAGEVRFVDL